MAMAGRDRRNDRILDGDLEPALLTSDRSCEHRACFFITCQTTVYGIYFSFPKEDLCDGGEGQKTITMTGEITGS